MVRGMTLQQGTINHEVAILAAMEIARRIDRDARQNAGTALAAHPGDDTGRVILGYWEAGRFDELRVFLLTVDERLTELHVDEPFAGAVTLTDLMERLDWAVNGDPAPIVDWMRADPSLQRFVS